LEKANWPLRHKAVFKICLADARAALAQPEPQGPTDDAELRTVYAIGAEARWREGFPEAWSLTDMERAAHTAGLHAALARWGRPAIEPVPVGERLPGPEDCDVNGIVWAWDSGCLRWDTAFWDAAFPSDTDITHWLPCWALPVPQQEAE
jgi:hypothetical protein